MEDFGEYLQDLIKDPRSVPPPDQLAPRAEGEVDPALKKEYDDPEVNAVDNQQPAGGFQEAHYTSRKRMREGVASDFKKKWAQSGSTDVEAFKQEAARLGLDPVRQVTDYNWGIRHGKIKAPELETGGKKRVAPSASGANPSAQQEYADAGKTAKQKKQSIGDDPYGVTDLSKFNPDEIDDEELMQFINDNSAAPEGDDVETVQDRYNQMQAICYSIASGRAIKRHALIYGDPGVGKTHDCKLQCEKGILQNPSIPEPKDKRFIFKSGSSGRSPSALLGLLYAFRNNFILMLDDNDAFLSTSDEIVQLILKGVFDPDTKAIATNPTIRQKSATFAKSEMGNYEKKYLNDSAHIKIDKDKLKEDILSITINGRHLQRYIDPEEAYKLREMIIDPEELRATKRMRENRRRVFGMEQYLYEAKNDDDDDDDDDKLAAALDAELGDNGIFDPNGPDDPLETEGKHHALPAEFTFNTSVIFISNLAEYEIDTAVLSRVMTYKLALDHNEFLERLQFIMPKYLPQPEYVHLPPEIFAWAKQCSYTYIAGVIKCFDAGAPVLGQPVVFKKKMQFRDVQTAAQQLGAIADDYAMKNGMDLRNKKDRDVISKALSKKFLQWLLTYFATPEKKSKFGN